MFYICKLYNFYGIPGSPEMTYHDLWDFKQAINNNAKVLLGWCWCVCSVQHGTRRHGSGQLPQPGVPSADRQEPQDAGKNLGARSHPPA